LVRPRKSFIAQIVKSIERKVLEREFLREVVVTLGFNQVLCYRSFARPLSPNDISFVSAYQAVNYCTMIKVAFTIFEFCLELPIRDFF